jgi:hypothetical protein
VSRSAARVRISHRWTLLSDRLVLGVSAGTRFRPLSLNVPKPLFPLAGQPMVHHPISACRRVCSLPSPTLRLCLASFGSIRRVRLV